MSDKRKEPEIKHGITDITLVLDHLKSEEKKARRELWIKENYTKLGRRKPDNDQGKMPELPKG